MWEIRCRNFFTFIVFIAYYSISLYTNAVEIVIPSVSVNTGECFAINVNLYKVEDEEIRTAVIVFAFDPVRIQIGCNTDFIPETGVNPIVFEQGTSVDEQPILLSNNLIDIDIKYSVAIYPQGIMVVVLWDGMNKIPPGLLFTVPCKLTENVIPGDKLTTPLISQEEPVYIKRTFYENQVESQAFYCSLADTNALPVNTTLTYGTIFVKNASEGEITEGEGYTEEGTLEGTNPEGTEEGNLPEGIIEGIIEGQTNEGNILEGTLEEGTREGENPVCGCSKKQGMKQQNISVFLQFLKINNLNIGFMVALVVILRQL